MAENSSVYLGTTVQDPNSAVDKASVGELVRRWLDPAHAWKLALVQRHEVWDELRMKRLLDSLLASYPIGTLLVCRVMKDTKVLVKEEGTRKAIRSIAGSWQLLDGQQRINALGCIFTDKGKYGRFLLDMFEPRVPDEIVTRVRAKRDTTKYIAWLVHGDGEVSSANTTRERFLDLSRWHRWAERVGDQGISELHKELCRVPQEKALLLKVLNDIDSAFADEIDAASVDVVGARTRRLLEIWTESIIPVQKVTLDTPLDVLQVFTRANLEGVRLDGEDVFFAAVKTIWNDAEENLDRVANATTLINRMTALRLIARLASRGISTGDIQPLKVDRLNGPKGRQIVDAMQHLAQDGSEVIARIGLLGELLTSESRLGFALREVNQMLFDHVFGWAAANPLATDTGYLRTQKSSIETYLLGATAFQYPSVFLDTFARIGFAEALEAGSNRRPFPADRIAEACREKWHELRRGRRNVPEDRNEEEHLELVDQNAGLFLSIVQNIPYSLPVRKREDDKQIVREVEWDHIYPQALAKKMRVPDPETGRPVHHRYRKHVWSAGNLWALDRPINTSAQDMPPSKKFDLLNQIPKNGLPSRWPSRENAFLTDSEIELLIEAEKLIEEGKLSRGMALFRDFARGRGLRLYEEIMRLYPGIRTFVPERGKPSMDYEPPASLPLRAQLGLDDMETEVVEEKAEIEGGYDGFEKVFSYGAERDIEHQLRMIVDKVRELGLYARPYVRSIMVTPPKKRTRMLFTVWPQREADGSLSIYRSSEAISEFFAAITREQALYLGPDGWGRLGSNEIEAFLKKLEQVMSHK